MDLRPLVPPSSGRTLVSEVALFLACKDMVEEEEARLFSTDNHGTHRFGVMESNLPTI